MLYAQLPCDGLDLHTISKLEQLHENITWLVNDAILPTTTITINASPKGLAPHVLNHLLNHHTRAMQVHGNDIIGRVVSLHLLEVPRHT